MFSIKFEKLTCVLLITPKILILRVSHFSDGFDACAVTSFKIHNPNNLTSWVNFFVSNLVYKIYAKIVFTNVDSLYELLYYQKH